MCVWGQDASHLAMETVYQGDPANKLPCPPVELQSAPPDIRSSVCYYAYEMKDARPSLCSEHTKFLSNMFAKAYQVV